MKKRTLVLAMLLTVFVTVGFAQGMWKRVADFGGGTRSYAAGFSIGGKAYIGTGINSANKDVKDFWEYDPAINKWSRKADFEGEARDAASAFSINGKGYIGLGKSGEYPFVYYKDLWEYDPVADKWTKKTDYPGIARAYTTGFSILNKGYIGGGYRYDTGPYSDLWEYDAVRNGWTKKANFAGGPRSNPFGLSIGEKGYMGLGWNGGWYGDFYEYDPKTDMWTKKADFGGTAREYTTGFSIGDKGYIGTGYPSALKDFWEYNPAANQWTRKSDYSGLARSGAVGFSMGNKGYIGTGNNSSTLYNDFWEYTPDGCYGFYVYADQDKDGYGNISGSLFIEDCIVPSGYVKDSTDCNDANASIHPNAYEVIGDGIDNNCNGIIDEVASNALSFDGSNDYVNCGNAVALQIDKEITVELWINPAGDARIIGKYDDQLKSGWRIHYYNSRFIFGVSSGITDHDLYSSITSTPNQWHHVAGTYNKSSGVLKIYVDDVVTEENGFTSGVLLNTKDNLNIGRFEAYGIAYGKATLDEVRLWNVVRSETEIKNSKYLHIDSNADGLVAYYPFDQGIAGGNNTGITIADDITANNNNGTLHNFALNGNTSNWVAGISLTSCGAPAGLNVAHVSDTCAILTWDATGAGTLKLQVRYKSTSDSMWIKDRKSPAKSKILVGGLTPNTTYRWQLRSFCTEDTSAWVCGPNFTTAPATFALMPVITNASNIKVNTVSIQVAPNPSNGNFTIQMHLPVKEALTTLALYNSLGERVWQQQAGMLSGAVTKSIALNNTLFTGIYILRIERNDVQLMQKVVVSK